MAISGDAVATGLVSSLARPGTNVTGSTFFLPELNAKRLEVLKEACPSIAHPTALSNPDNPVSRPIIPTMQSAATPVTLGVARTQGPSEFDRAFEAMAGSHVDSVVVTEDGEFAPNFQTIAALALQNRLPSIGAEEYAEEGGLIGYGANISLCIDARPISWSASSKVPSRLTSLSSSRQGSSSSSTLELPTC